MADKPRRSNKKPVYSPEGSTAARSAPTAAMAGKRKMPAPESGRGQPADWISHQLRDLYGEVAREPLPESLRELLDRIDRQDAEDSGAGGG